MKVVGKVYTRIRRFIPDPNGNVVRHDGVRGRYGSWVHLKPTDNLLTDAGRDFLHQQGYETSGLDTNGGNYVALTTNSNAPADGDTTLTDEISSGGLSRAQGTVAHSAGTNSTTVTKTFTASATHTAVAKSALFTAASVGTMVHEALLSSTVNLESGDELEIQWTITIDD